jgi:TolB-like protein/tetratricopeptide (TPR) repeat protein
MPLQVGDRLGPYEIQSAIGAGGMGEVYRARDTRLERDVALKVLPAAALGDATAHARLVREAQLASKLNHPHICTIYDVGEADPSADSAASLQVDSGQAVAYIAMELVDGQPLSACLADGPLPTEQVLRYGQQLADALAHAHARGVIHRDLKSANVMVTPESQIKVLDFGLAKRLTDEDLAEATTVSRQSLTGPGMVAGTLAYMAPEQLRGRLADARSDVWALGVVLYEMAVGRRPFGGDTAYEVSSAILNEPPRALPAGVPPGLVGIIERCLAKDPSQRYQRAGEVRSALEAVASGGAVSRWPAWRAAAWSRRWLLSGAAALALLLACVSLVGLDVGGVRSRLVGGTAGVRAIRLAVLPFANLSGDPEQEYFSDAVTEEMIAELGGLNPERLEVIARTSVMRFKDTKTPIDQIARDLKGLDYILEGSTRRESGRVRIRAELIQVSSQTQLWTATYERDMAEILVLESEVAKKVAGSLALRLLPKGQGLQAAARVINPEAYEAWLKGNNSTDFDAKLEYYELALKKDPKYAPAYAGIANVWVQRGQFWLTPPREAAQKAKTAALTAVELDSTFPAGHRHLAMVYFLFEWDWAAAELEFKRTIELYPSLPLPMYSTYLILMKRSEEATANWQRLVRLDPLNWQNQMLHAYLFMMAGRHDDFIAQERVWLGKHPQDRANRWLLATNLFAKARYKESLEELKTYYHYGADREMEEALPQWYVQSGYSGAMRRAADLLAERSHETAVIPSDVAALYAMAGEDAQAIAWLEKSLEVRDPNMPLVGVNPEFGSLHNTAGFQAILRQMNLPQ